VVSPSSAGLRSSSVLAPSHRSASCWARARNSDARAACPGTRAAAAAAGCQLGGVEQVAERLQAAADGLQAVAAAGGQRLDGGDQLGSSAPSMDRQVGHQLGRPPPRRDGRPRTGVDAVGDLAGGDAPAAASRASARA
jgi:hypothetical protein